MATMTEGEHEIRLPLNSIAFTKRMGAAMNVSTGMSAVEVLQMISLVPRPFFL